MVTNNGLAETGMNILCRCNIHDWTKWSSPVNGIYAAHEGAIGYFAVAQTRVCTKCGVAVVRKLPQVLIDHIEKLGTELRWIPVTERSPGIDYRIPKRFMVLRIPKRFMVLVDDMDIKVLFFDNGIWRDWRGDRYNVTHWMPLPELPGEAK